MWTTEEADHVVIDDATLMRLRWRALQLDDRADRDVAGIVGWFGAVQAQDARHAAWAIGVRASDLTRSQVLAAHREQCIVRTWVMRGTLHYVPAADAGWMVEHLACRMRPAVVARLAKVGLDDPRASTAVDALVAALAEGPQTRSACRAAIGTALGEVTAEQAGRVIDLAALDAGVLPDASDGGEQRYTLLDAVVPAGRRLDRSEAHRTIAQRYVRSHGPVTAADLARWAGMTLTDARRAISELADELVTATWNDTTVHLTKELADLGPAGGDGPVRLLPAFDEHVIGYASRQPTVPIEHDRHIVPGGNGIYQATIAAAGRTLGTWKAARGARVVPVWFDGDHSDAFEVAAADWYRFDEQS